MLTCSRTARFAPAADAARHALELAGALAGERAQCVVGPALGIAVGGLGMADDEEFHGFMVLSMPWPAPLPSRTRAS